MGRGARGNRALPSLFLRQGASMLKALQVSLVAEHLPRGFDPNALHQTILAPTKGSQSKGGLGEVSPTRAPIDWRISPNQATRTPPAYICGRVGWETEAGYQERPICTNLMDCMVWL